MASSKLIGTAADQAPSNADLGTLAFQDSNAVKITGGDVTANHYVDTAISEVKPSLLLDFANGKTLDPRITFTRSTTATYYDGKTTAKAEENLFKYSQDFDNAAWAKYVVSVSPNAAIAPDGTLTADIITPLVTNEYHYIYYSTTVSVSNPTFSVYAKSNGYSNLFMRSNTGGGYMGVNFNLATGAISGIEGSVTGSITSVGNGWYRCVVNYSGQIIDYQHQLLIHNSTNTGPTFWPADGSSGILLWGAQLEQRSGASAYTPTTSSPVTNYIPALQTAGGGAPRFDHDPITGESKGLLIEEQRTNLCLSSNTFSVNNGPYNIAIIPNANVAPDGTLTADMIYGTSATVFNYVGKYVTGLTTTSTQTNSVYAKAGTENYLWMSIANNGGTIGEPNTTFDLVNGKVISNSCNVSAGIAYVGNGWYRCWQTHTLNANAGSTYACTISVSKQSGDRTSNRSIYVWGCQVEAGAFPTSYIPTTSAQVTRSADVPTMTGTNFSSWFNPQEGALYAEASVSQIGTSARLFSLDSGSVANMVDITVNVNGSVSTEAIVSSVYSGNISGATTAANVPFKVSAAWVFPTISGLSFNGAQTVTGSIAISNQLNTLLLGRQSNGSATLNGWLKRLAYYPKRLSNAELQEMTQ